MNRSIGETVSFVDVAGSPMEVLQCGQGEVVVLAHSYLWDAAMWRPQIKELSKRYRVLAPNLWGHGGSGPLPKGTRDLGDLARHHLELLDRLGVSRFSFVGHSVGGMWGAELALAAPERVRSFVLMDTCLQREPEMARNRYFAMLDAIEATHVVPAAILQEVAGMFFSPYVSSWAPELIWDFRSRLADWDTDRLLDSVVPLGRMTFGRRETLIGLSLLSMPKLVMHGTEDVPRPIDEGRRMSKALDCPFIAFAGAGHMPSLETPGDVTHCLLDFLDEVHRAGQAPSPSVARNAAKAPVGSAPGAYEAYEGTKV